MQLILFRHGIAEPLEEAGSDANRALTSRGVDRTMLAAHGLARVCERPQVILTSPKVRAVQTAAILGEVFDLTPLAEVDLIDGQPAALLKLLRRRRETSVMMVGHEPWMSAFIHRLCSREKGEPFIEFKKSAAALVEAPIHDHDAPGTGRLLWLMPPRVLRSLAGN